MLPRNRHCKSDKQPIHQWEIGLLSRRKTSPAVWQKRLRQKKTAKSPPSGLAPVSNVCLNFSRSFETDRKSGRQAMWQRIPSRFVSRLLVSIISGFLLNCQWGHAAEPPVTHAIPASLEMMQLLRDEHGLIGEMVKAQLATERGDLIRPTARSSGQPDRTSAAIRSRRAIAAR
jgi:hypothetical protein